jgi:sulfatase maturation enzyme AslB (radical SAM superfamily)
MNKPINFCTVPFTTFEVDSNGGANICCRRSDQIVKDNGEKFSVINDSISEIWNSNCMNKLRTQFLNNERPDECSTCWTDEKITKGQSLRVDQYHKPVDFQNPKITHLVLKLTNLCNEACLTCSPHDSSLWQDEFIKNSIPLKSVSLTDSMINSMRTLKFQGDNLEALHEISPNLTSITLRGGEPTIHKEAFDYIEFLSNNGYAKQITLEMNTNALAYNPKLIEYLSNFKQAHILLSADGYEEINEYIRWPSKWDKIDQNIKRYTGLGDPFSIGINLTVSIWNIFYIEEILEYFKSYSSFVNINLVHYPKLQSIRNMPRPLKAKVLRQLVQLPDTERLKSFINLPPNLDKELTLEEYQDAILKYVAPLDASRNLDIKINLPRLYDLLSKPSC